MVSYTESQAPQPTPKIHIADQCAFEYLDMTAWKSPSADTFIRPYRRPCSHTPSLSCLVLSLFHLCLNSWTTQSFCTWVWGFQQHHSKMQPDSWNVSCMASMHVSTASRPTLIFSTDMISLKDVFNFYLKFNFMSYLNAVVALVLVSGCASKRYHDSQFHLFAPTHTKEEIYI